MVQVDQQETHEVQQVFLVALLVFQVVLAAILEALEVQPASSSHCCWEVEGNLLGLPGAPGQAVPEGLEAGQDVLVAWTSYCLIVWPRETRENVEELVSQRFLCVYFLFFSEVMTLSHVKIDNSGLLDRTKVELHQ